MLFELLVYELSLPPDHKAAVVVVYNFDNGRFSAFIFGGDLLDELDTQVLVLFLLVLDSVLQSFTPVNLRFALSYHSLTS